MDVGERCGSFLTTSYGISIRNFDGYFSRRSAKKLNPLRSHPLRESKDLAPVQSLNVKLATVPSSGDVGDGLD